MTRTQTSAQLRRIYVLFLACLFLAFGFSMTYAQESSGSAEPAVQKYRLTFPVSTLGNCADLKSCKEYCEDPVHQEACTNFAKTKGFYKPNAGQGNARNRLILEKAKTELGCATDEECKAFCKEEVNREKCEAFAKKYQLQVGKKEINQAILEKAKAALGCTTEEECKAVCKLEVNREKCSSFARQVGISGGLVKIASPSGKALEGFEQIKKMMENCRENPDYCEKNIATFEAELVKKSNEFCKANPAKCKEMEKEMKNTTNDAKLIKDKLKPKPASGGADMREFKGKIQTGDKDQFGKQLGAKNSQVQGVSTSLSLIDKVWNFFFR